MPLFIVESHLSDKLSEDDSVAKKPLAEIIVRDRDTMLLMYLKTPLPDES